MQNPLLNPRPIRHEAFPFDAIRLEHFMPAFEEALALAEKDIDAIRKNTDTPTFANTMQAMEDAGDKLHEVVTVYFNLMSAESNDEFKELAQEISPRLAQYGNSIIMDPVLFDKVKYLHQHQGDLNLNAEQARLLDNSWRSFVRNGAQLADEEKQKLMKINMDMAKLSPKFNQNVLGATNSFELHVTDKKQLEGIPENSMKAAAHLAKVKGKEEGWLFNLQPSSFIPLMSYCANRELREKIWRAFSSRGLNGNFDNRELVLQIVNLRAERAKLLGFDTHAAYTLTERMAEEPAKVMEFLDRIYEISMPKAKQELAELKKFAKELDDLDELMPWDAGYYSEKLKKNLFHFDAEDLRPYFKLENVIDGVFTVANKMYGLKFEQVDDVPTYHKDVKVYEVKESDDSYVGLLYMDLFPRDTKSGGAWMTTFRSQGMHRNGMKRPHVSIVASLTPSTADAPSLLSLREVETVFHEFGHALHALLSDVHYASLASPNVWWDFVELPSQIMENWVTEKEALDLFARHYQTGKNMPAELIEKVKKAQTFHSAMGNIRQLTYAYLDMAWHNVNPSNIKDVVAYEDEVLEKTRLYPKVEGSVSSVSFGHIFAGGYAAGYYSYKWAEALESDAFEFFKETGIFNRDTAAKFRNEILSQGNRRHPMELYKAFRDREPDPDAMLRRDGLL